MTIIDAEEFFIQKKSLELVRWINGYQKTRFEIYNCALLWEILALLSLHRTRALIF